MSQVTFNPKQFPCPVLFYEIDFFFLVELGLCCSARAFPSCGEQGLLSSCGAPAPHCGGFSCGAQAAVGAGAAVVVGHGLGCSMHGMWDLPRPGVEPMSPARATREVLKSIFLESLRPRVFFKNVYLAAACLSVAHQIFSCGI